MAWSSGTRIAVGGLVGMVILLSVPVTYAVTSQTVFTGQGGLSEFLKVAMNANQTSWPAKFTLFAPSNSAVKKYACLKDTANVAAASKVLLYHLLPAAYTKAQIVTKTAKGPWIAYTALSGQKLNITSDAKGVVWLNGVAKLSSPDILNQTSYTIEGIDKLLLPTTVPTTVCSNSSAAAVLSGQSMSSPHKFTQTPLPDSRSVLDVLQTLTRSRSLDIAIMVVSLVSVAHFV